MAASASAWFRPNQAYPRRSEMSTEFPSSHSAAPPLAPLRRWPHHRVPPPPRPPRSSLSSSPRSHSSPPRYPLLSEWVHGPPPSPSVPSARPEVAGVGRAHHRSPPPVSLSPRAVVAPASPQRCCCSRRRRCTVPYPPVAAPWPEVAGAGWPPCRPSPASSPLLTGAQEREEGDDPIAPTPCHLSVSGDEFLGIRFPLRKAYFHSTSPLNTFS